MEWKYFADLFHESWHKKMKPWVESEDCDKVYKFLKSESRKGKQIAPLSKNVFRSFKETTFGNLNVIILGLCPYHSFVNNKPVTSGLLMDCSNTGRLQPSLEKFYEAIEYELYNGMNLNLIKDPSLSYLAKQGVFLGNVSLTVERSKPGSHLEIWKPFMEYFLGEVTFGTGVPVVFLGKEAAKYKKHLGPLTRSFCLSHPASASYNSTRWETEGLFTKLNTILKESNGIEIQWIKK